MFPWLYRKIVPSHRRMWQKLQAKHIIPANWRAYVLIYGFKKKLGLCWSRRKYKSEGRFFNIHIDTYAYCNRKCRFCFNNERLKTREGGIMSIGTYKRIIDELGGMKYSGKISPYFYGEPLSDRRMPYLISYARKRCPLAFIQLNSNGDFLTENLLENLIAAGLDKIFVTNYEKVGLVEETSVERIAEQNMRLTKLQATYPQFVELRHWKRIEFENRGGMVLNRINENVHHACLRPSCMMVIDWKGNVLLCCVDYYAQHVFGDVATNHLLQIWNNGEFQRMKQILQKPGGRQKIDICVKCDAPGFLGD